MPYPNEHSCRLEDPDKFDKFNRKNCGEKHDGKCIDVIYGIKDNKSKIQALRYKTDTWDEDDARAHCKSREGTFEAAKKEKKSLGNKIEYRAFELTDIEVRSEDGEKPKIRGHAAVFNKLSVDLGGFKEMILPGAFAESIKRDDIRALKNHDPNYILGRNMAGTLSLEEDEKGLYVEIDPPDTSYARDLEISIERGDINQMSFAFLIDGKNGEKWEINGKEVEPDEAFMTMWGDKKSNVVRKVLKTRLFDVSPATYPGYPQTDVKVRSILEAAGIDFERLAGVFEKSRHDVFSQEETALIGKVIEKLRSYLPEEAEEPGDGGPREVTGDVDRKEMWRRKLELAAIK